jgi:sulfide:quinone oxidoreductase
VTRSASRVLVAGGGPAAIELLLALRDLAGDRPSIELIAPEQDLVVRAYDVLAPFHEGHERRYPLATIAADLDVSLVSDALVAVDAGGRTVALRSGAEHPYDSLVVAVGARHLDTVPGAEPFRGSRDANRLKTLLVDSRAGVHGRVAFVVPSGRTWPLPLYELALHTSAWLAEHGVAGVSLVIVSPEREPLAVFGSRASSEVAAVLDSHQIEFISGHAVRFDNGRLLLTGGRELEVGLTIALPRLGGSRIGGLPSDEEGFIPVDEVGRVDGIERVFAAGDATAFPVKQGGIATQQADAIAQQLALELGAPVTATPLTPVLRSVLFGGRERRYLHAELGDSLDESSRASVDPMWPESSKVVGRYLSPYLEGAETRDAPA